MCHSSEENPVNGREEKVGWIFCMLIYIYFLVLDVEIIILLTSLVNKLNKMVWISLVKVARY